MPNTFITASMITNEALMILTNQLSFGKHVNRAYDNRFGVDGAKIGYTLNIRKPPRYLGTAGAGLGVEDITDSYVALTVDKQYHVDTGITSADLLMSLNSLSDQYLKPATATLANYVDFTGTSQVYKNVANYVGTPATVPADLDIYLNAVAALNNCAAPVDEQRYVAITPAMQAKIAFALKGLFNPTGTIGKIVEKGEMGVAAGLQWHMDQNIPTHTIGPLGGAPTTSGAITTSITAIPTKGWTNAAASRLKAGDIFTVATCYQANPQNHQSTGVLQPFVVTADFSSAADGTGSVSVYPPLTPSGAFQTVVIPAAGIADGAAITVFGTTGQVTPQALAFHKDAFTLAVAPLPIPNGVDMASRSDDPDLGISVRFIRAYDPSLDRLVSRLDILFGWACLRPEIACRIAS